MNPKKIITVDDNLTNLAICKNVLKNNYEVYPVSSAAGMFDLLGRFLPDLILLDVEMPEINGYETARILKNNNEYKDVPFIFVTGNRDEQSEMKGLDLGALDYIFIPFVKALFLRRIETHLSLIDSKRELKDLNDSIQKMLIRKMTQVYKLQCGVLGAVTELIERRDKVTGRHIHRTQKLLECLVEELLEEDVYTKEISTWDLELVLPSAQLHDLGKISISDVILNKPGKLDKEEFEIIKTHAQIGVDAINQIEETADDYGFLLHAKRFAGTHHEKWDGTGYPNGLAGSGIPIEGRLLAIVDVYDALTSERPYKKPVAPSEAAAVIIEGRGTHFDPQLVDVFKTIAHKFEKIVENDYNSESGVSDKPEPAYNDKAEAVYA